MRSIVRQKYGIACLTLVMALISLSWTNPGSGLNLKWHSFDEGSTKAKAEGKQILIDIYTDWCHWCKVMDEKTYSDEKFRST